MAFSIKCSLVRLSIAFPPVPPLHYYSGSQLVARLVTFGLNLITTRFLTPAAYGVAAVQFHLLNTIILFLSREGFRRGCLRADPSDPKATSKVIGVSLLTIPIGFFLSLVICGGVLLRSSSQDPSYRFSILLQGAAALLELLSEPAYNLATVRLWFGMRVGGEAAANIGKAVVTLTCLQHGIPPVLAFSYGQIAFAGSLLVIYAVCFALRSPGRLRVLPEAHLDNEIIRISSTFALQAGGKLLLAEGSKAALAVATPLQEQGVYGLVTNLGSLVVRTIFQPFEEIAFVAFSRPIGSDVASLHERAVLLSSLCRGISLLGAVAAAFGPAFSHLALLILYGQRWVNSGAPTALALYSAYVALLAVNGILEAFVHAVADGRGLRRANIALAVLSLLHIALSTVAVKSGGAVGLLLADGANMALRIAYCLQFCASFFKGIGGMQVWKLLPSMQTLGVLGVSFIATQVSQLVFMPEGSFLADWVRDAWPVSPLLLVGPGLLTPGMRASAHVGIGVACLASVSIAVYSGERDAVQKLLKIKSKPVVKKE